VVKPVKDRKNTSIGYVYLESLAIRVDGAMRVVVACKPIIGPAGNVKCEVQRPAESECDGKCEDSAWWIVKVFGVPTDAGFFLRNKDFISLKGTCIRMVAAMAVLPGEVRDKKTGVEDEANQVIEPLVVTEGMVATLVSYDPEASEDTTLENPVDWPSQV